MIRYVLPLTNPEKDITVTTYREDDPNGTAASAFLCCKFRDALLQPRN